MNTYSTLMPCRGRAGAAVHLGINRVIAGEDENFQEHGQGVLARHGIEVIGLDLA
jgi:tRNA(Arg) A34 adenosine deaminase TadA